MSNNNKKTEKNNHYSVSIFLRNHAHEYNLTIYHKMILRIIADYCDMPLNYCCVKQKNLAFECGMSERELRYGCLYLIEKNLIHRVMKGKLYRYRIGEIITGFSNDVV